MPHQCTECGRTFEDGSKEMLSGCPECDGNKFQFIPKGAVNDANVSASPSEPPTRDDDANAVSKAATTVRDWVARNSQDEKKAWPKSATEDYDTPAEKAAARSSGSPRATSGSAEAASSAESAPGSPETSPEPTPSTSKSTDTARRETPPSESGQPGSGTPDGEATTSPPEEQEPSGGISARTMSTEDNAQASARSDVVSPDELPDPGEATAASSSRDIAADRARDTPDRAGASASPPEPTEATQPGKRGQPTEGRVVSEPADTEVTDKPDLDELREELNQQFESIKILNPGQYELNLMELYDREEYIISLREDGRYVIDVPDSWRGSE
ncbi:OapC/ArvC family zinc-ribbon domain-containing protein [Haloarchaeobius sp. DT45]|uniref:Zn-ribbon domain-containing protein n=1 Tax=Haloarchaeobius sp. DT45 TaxID=3446116 RepID=UPI003F6A853C